MKIAVGRAPRGGRSPRERVVARSTPGCDTTAGCRIHRERAPGRPPGSQPTVAGRPAADAVPPLAAQRVQIAPAPPHHSGFAPVSAVAPPHIFIIGFSLRVLSPRLRRWRSARRRVKSGAGRRPPRTAAAVRSPAHDASAGFCPSCGLRPLPLRSCGDSRRL